MKRWWIALILVACSSTVFAGDCGFESFSARFSRFMNPERYWAEKVPEIEDQIKFTKAEIVYHKLEVVKIAVTTKIRFKQAEIDELVGIPASVSRELTANSIKEEIEDAKSWIKTYQEFLQSYEKCLETAKGEAAKFYK